MLIYLDNANSRREQPNENFAREVMELFTLGEGNYSEQDIKEMARAFTGWSLDRETGEFMFRRGMHDAGVKTIFGKRANFDGDQALDLLLKQPETAVFITRKLWREFVSPAPDEADVVRLAALFRESGYSIAKLMQAMLVSDAFYAADNPAAWSSRRLSLWSAHSSSSRFKRPTCDRLCWHRRCLAKTFSRHRTSKAGRVVRRGLTPQRCSAASNLSIACSRTTIRWKRP